MKTFVKLFASATFALASAAAAYATPVTGAITIAGTDSYTATNITFTPNVGSVTSASGTLSSFAPTINGNGTITNFAASLTNFAFANGVGTTVFTIGSNLSFTIASLNAIIDRTGALSVVGTGTFAETGYDATLGAFTLTSSSSGVTGFQLTSSVTPEPSSLILLGTGLVGTAGMMFSRRRRFSM